MSVTDIISMPKQDRWLFDITYDFGDEFRSDLDETQVLSTKIKYSVSICSFQ